MTIIGQRRSNLNNPRVKRIRIWEAEDVQPIVDVNGVQVRADVFARLIWADPARDVGQSKVFSLQEWNEMLLMRDRDVAEYAVDFAIHPCRFSKTEEHPFSVWDDWQDRD